MKLKYYFRKKKNEPIKELREIFKMKNKLTIFVVILALFTLTGCCFPGGSSTTAETTMLETTASETTAPDATSAETTAPEITIPETTAKETTSDSAAETTAAETTAAETTAAETTDPKEAPTIELKIYEGPTFSAADNVCYYRIEAVVTGNPNPTLQFSKDDSDGVWGSKKVQINLHAGESYTLKATATNSEGSATVSKNLAYGCAEGANKAPILEEIRMLDPNPETNTTYDISAVVTDPDDDLLTYNWSVDAGTLTSSITNPTNWKTPAAAGEYTISVFVSDGNGHTVNKTKKVQVLPAPPVIVIEDIDFPDKVLLDNPNVIIAVLNDPSQEANVSWSWKVSSGVTVRAINSKMAWIPDREGENEVTVEIKNEKGEILSSRTETVLVIPIRTVNLNLNKIESEGGFIEKDGAVYAGGKLYAGDSNNNKGCTGLVSFDISGLAGKKIQSAQASFLISQGWGNPLDFSEYLSLTSYYWGPRVIRHGDDTANGDILQTFEPATFACFSYELKVALQNAIDAGRSRFQMRIHFAGGFITDNDSNWDGWEYPQNNIKLNVTYLTAD